VRYVDETLAVIEAHLNVLPRMQTAASPARPLPSAVEILVEVEGSDTFFDEQRVTAALHNGAGMLRYHVVHPQRWWPAGMGDQSLYAFRLSLLSGGEPIDTWSTTLGFTSVRRTQGERLEGAGTLGNSGGGRELLVNGRVRAIKSVVPVDTVHERGLLPAAGDILLVVRDHYGTDALYHAADRGGVLLVQCVPVDAQGRPDTAMAPEVERLVTHPSLVGWFVGHLGQMSDAAARRLKALDPAHHIFLDVPGLSLS
jgi:hypothetical protein